MERLNLWSLFYIIPNPISLRMASSLDTNTFSKSYLFVEVIPVYCGVLSFSRVRAESQNTGAITARHVDLSTPIAPSINFPDLFLYQTENV